MIRSFKSDEAEKIFNRIHSKRFASLERVIFRKLRSIHRAAALGDLTNPPGNRLEALRGDRAGQYSIRINEQWRICFEWRENHAYEVEIVDYH
ncbi:type II toxin-antitoxin system RelE/ParE family toxin [Granulicella mallensis]|uniref:Plasmid maintenance system killer n=1 Tax=Granulicella mallensis (strain ATCC BAA-1857 / DSM 23137 / MP5ACTX8) TaxID=682795 RepID=G8NPJ6_GRAMM|nr:type II toxin-antitoxin system RelE/ParE family toxin [Granulicella mallensis]AEU36008.1 plasmid maintenance system killer [Granulicella mallensis MP5ACTX8]